MKVITSGGFKNTKKEDRESVEAVTELERDFKRDRDWSKKYYGVKK